MRLPLHPPAHRWQVTHRKQVIHGMHNVTRTNIPRNIVIHDNIPRDNTPRDNFHHDDVTSHNTPTHNIIPPRSVLWNMSPPDNIPLENIPHENIS